MSVDIKDLVGEVFVSVESTHEAVVFIKKDDSGYRMEHIQDCCEVVWLDDVCGDLDDLAWSPILVAEEINGEAPASDDGGDPLKWTFYKIATIKGSVTIRWCADAFAYYSTSIDIYPFF